MTGCPVSSARSTVFRATTSATLPSSVRWQGLPRHHSRSPCPPLRSSPLPGHDHLATLYWPAAPGILRAPSGPKVGIVQTTCLSLSEGVRVSSSDAGRSLFYLCRTHTLGTGRLAWLRARLHSQPWGTSSRMVLSSAHHRVHRNRTL